MNMLMNGVNPVGMVYNQSAENIAYSSGVSVKDKIDSVASNMSIVTVNNGQNTVTINLPFTGNGQIFLFNANRGIVGLIKIEPAQTTPVAYIDMLGSRNPSFSLSNNVLSINWGERTWGTTCYMLTWE